MNYAALVKAINAATTRLQGQVATVANQALVLRNWLVGAYQVEFEQNGKDRAKYGTRLLESLATDMANRGIKGLDVRTLRDCRFLFHHYPQIRGAATPDALPGIQLPPAPPREANTILIRGIVTSSDRQGPCLGWFWAGRTERP